MINIEIFSKKSNYYKIYDKVIYQKALCGKILIPLKIKKNINYILIFLTKLSYKNTFFLLKN